MNQPMLTLLLDIEDYSAGEVVIYSIMTIGLFFIYFLPSYVGRKKSNSSSITLLNLFLGWTFLGWVVALIWASTNDPKPVVQVVGTAPGTAPLPSTADELLKLQALRDAGTLTAEEFDQQKQRVLGQLNQPTVPSPQSVAAELHRLEVSRQLGLLSNSEYTQQKQRLLRQA